jgi:hypothetical protein
VQAQSFANAILTDIRSSHVVPPGEEKNLVVPIARLAVTIRCK